MLNLGRRVVESYQYVHNKRPFLTQAINLGILYASGDFAAQFIENHFKKKKKLEEEEQHLHVESIDTDLEATTERSHTQNNIQFDRALHMGSFGLFLDAPLLYYWYKLLDSKIPARSMSAISKKIVLDQVVCTPVIYILFFPFLGVMKGHSWEEIKTKTKKDFLPTILYDATVWVPANLINFRYVSPTYRVAYIGVISFMWSVYLAFIGSEK